MQQNLTPFAKIHGLHGIRGEFTIDSYFSNENTLKMLDSNLTYYLNEMPINLTYKGVKKGVFIVQTDLLKAREDCALHLRDTIYISKSVARDICGLQDGVAYNMDFINASLVYAPENREIGLIEQVVNFGAGDLMQVRKPNGDIEFIRLDNSTKQTLDIKNSVLRVNFLI